MNLFLVVARSFEFGEEKSRQTKRHLGTCIQPLYDEVEPLDNFNCGQVPTYGNHVGKILSKRLVLSILSFTFELVTPRNDPSSIVLLCFKLV